jgi:hypothetical protein
MEEIVFLALLRRLPQLPQFFLQPSIEGVGAGVDAQRLKNPIQKPVRRQEYWVPDAGGPRAEQASKLEARALFA